MDRIGRYRIVKELGRGAMGVVYQAVDPTIGRTLAIKTIRLREVDDPAQRDRLKERLFREARSAGLINHPGIVTIYDMEEDEGVAYIAMQFVNGPTLDEVMSRPQPLAAREMFGLLRQTAVALDFAHEKGIVHRDIKPANIMIDEHGNAKIADFGIAKVGASANLTLSGAILGTPNYMSPEQVQGKPVDGRADQFSLAVVAFEILTGERPFAGEHLGTVVYKIVAEPPPPTHLLNPSLSPGIDTIIRKALSKDAGSRYRNCVEFINSLEAECLRTEGWESLARGTSHSIPTEASPGPGASRRRAARGTAKPKPGKARQQKAQLTSDAPPSARSLFFPALLAFVVVLGSLAFLAWQAGIWQPDSRPPVHVADEQQPSPRLEEKAAGTKPADDLETPPPPQPEVAAAETPQSAPEQQPEPPKEEPRRAKANGSAPSTRFIATVANAPVRRAPVLTAKAASVKTLPESAPSEFGPLPQDIYAQTNPAGATAVLDNRRETACQTPCVLLGSPGSHILSLTLPNYQKEIRAIRVGAEREDVPLVTLRPVGGELMVSTDPPGANIFVNGRLQGSLTPAQLALPMGSYQITVELNRVRKSQIVDIRNGNTNYLRMILDR